MALGTTKIFRSQRGTSLIEMVVTMGIISSLMGAGVLSLNRRFFDLESTGQTIVNDLRLTRMQATLKATHYRIKLQSTSYKIEPLQDSDGDGVWTVDSSRPSRQVNLPPGFIMVSTSSSGSGSNVIFDGRGMLLKEDGSQGYSIMVILVVAPDAKNRVLRVWPSGQVELVNYA